MKGILTFHKILYQSKKKKKKKCTGRGSGGSRGVCLGESLGRFGLRPKIASSKLSHRLCLELTYWPKHIRVCPELMDTSRLPLHLPAKYQ